MKFLQLFSCYLFRGNIKKEGNTVITVVKGFSHPREELEVLYLFSHRRQNPQYQSNIIQAYSHSRQ